MICDVCKREQFPSMEPGFNSNLCYRLTLPRDPTCWKLGYGRLERQNDPELDCTDFAHPAWWRGEKFGTDGVIKAVTRILDGKKHVGTYNYAPLEALVQRVEKDTGYHRGLEDAARLVEDGMHGFEIHGFVKPKRAAEMIRNLSKGARLPLSRPST